MLPANRYLSKLLRRNPLRAVTSMNMKLEFSLNTTCFKSRKSRSSLFKPVPVKYNADDINVGKELTGELPKSELLNVISKFSIKPEIRQLALESGINESLFKEALIGFRRYCVQSPALPTDLHVVISDILQGHGNVVDIYPYFIRHAKEMFPHIECMDDLKQIGDLRTPASWYPEARAMTRKIIFHAGPTNSGKTYHALERFIKAKSGIYCGPLKMLAVEIHKKCNDSGTPCDLITGEERSFAKDEDHPSTHISCTVEMVNVENKFEVAVIDEIQMMADVGRGWAWTRALLGIPAEEVHLCGEAGAMEFLQNLLITTGEQMEVRRYNRLTELIIENSALRHLSKVQKGDCIVCFNKNDIYTVTRTLEERGTEAAVIYGSLPPGTKLAQAAKFNDPNHSCKVMVATDAIGMGLNLHIRRIIFYSLIKPVMNKRGEREMKMISVSQALQIAGRAGRFKTQWETGYVTSFKEDDLEKLQKLLKQQPDAMVQAGLHPTAEQIELFAYHLPNATLSNLMDIFVELCTMDDSLYFMCNTEDFKFLADMIQHVSLPLKTRYTFCCAPLNRKVPFVCTMFLKFARQYSKNEPITFKWLCQQIGWSLRPPRTLLDLIHLEGVFDILDLYLWLSYRFPDMFPEQHIVREMQKELDQVIQQGIVRLTHLVRNNSEPGTSEDEPSELSRKNQQSAKGNFGSYTEKLIRDGLLTSTMLSELQKEWSQVNSFHNLRIGELHCPPKQKVTVFDILNKILSKKGVTDMANQKTSLPSYLNHFIKKHQGSRSNKQENTGSDDVMPNTSQSKYKR